MKINEYVTVIFVVNQHDPKVLISTQSKGQTGMRGM